MERLSNVRPTDAPFTLALEWADGQKQTADLSGLIALSSRFNLFANDPDAFAKVHVINWGHGVGWDNGFDYSAENLARIAAEQTVESGPQLITAFQARFKLTNEQLGRALGYKKSQIKNFKAGNSPLNQAVRVSLHAMAEQPTILYARLAG